MLSVQPLGELRATWPAPPPPSTGSTHDHFNRLVASSKLHAAWSLRDQAQITPYMDQSNPAIKPWDVTYDPTNDMDPRRQDAAKVHISFGRVSLGNGVKIPIPNFAPLSIFGTWDAWFGKEFAYQYTQIGNYKTFQWTSPQGRIWTEEKCDWDLAEKMHSVPGFENAVAINQIRYYGDAKHGQLGANATKPHPLSPYTLFGIMPETWTRYSMFLLPRPDLPLASVTGPDGLLYTGIWWQLYQWMSDVNRDPILTIPGLFITPNYGRKSNEWDAFWLEFNTSDHGLAELTPERTAYVRNIAMLKDVTLAEVQALLEKPVL